MASNSTQLLLLLLWLIFLVSPLGGLYYFLRAHFLDIRRQRNKALQSGLTMLRYVQTADGWRLAVVRYPPDPAAPSRNYPVLLLHGLSGNRLCFDLPNHPSLARTLAHAGFDVWVLECRGSNMSFHPDYPTRREIQQWVFSDYVDMDIASAVAFILSSTGQPHLHCVGHSMGGIISTAYAALSPAQSRQVRSNVMIASSLTYLGTGSNFEKLVPLYYLAKVCPSLADYIIPHGLITQLQDLAAGLAAVMMPVYSAQQHSNADNVALDAWRQLHRFGFHSVPARLILSLYSAAGKSSGLQDSKRVPYLTHMETTIAGGGVMPPTLMLGGTVDPQCPLRAIQQTADRMQKIRPGAVQVLPFGRVHGHVADYNHTDFLLGTRVETEVFPVILRFLVANDCPLT